MLALAIPGASTARPPGVSIFWWTVGTCETGHIGLPSDGVPRFDWGKYHRPKEGTIYEGFVGFKATTWQEWARTLGLLASYPHAYDAPPAVQARVASYGLTLGGNWGCIKDHPSYLSLPGH